MFLSIWSYEIIYLNLSSIKYESLINKHLIDMLTIAYNSNTNCNFIVIVLVCN